MDVNAALPLLGGLTPAAFMRRHWQKKPLLVRQAVPGGPPPVGRAELFALAAREGVESRLVERRADGWQVRHGPLSRRALPPLARPGWTLLVQGLDLHAPAAHDCLQRFRFVPDARLDDLMVSWASPGGGVGPHLDRYDVFLLQVQGRRRWRIGRARDTTWQAGTPLRLLRHFEPTEDWLLEPGDMLYLPPLWAHEGVADGGDCMTCSIGFRAPRAGELARELLLRLADAQEEDDDDDDGGACGKRAAAGYRDADQPATDTPAALPAGLQQFAREALSRLLADPQALPRALGAWASEPKPGVWFEAAAARAATGRGVQLDPASRMLYDERHVFINGEAFVARGADVRLMRQLADRRRLDARACARLSANAATLLSGWQAAGWLHAGPLP